MRKRKEECADCGSTNKGSSQYYCKPCTNKKHNEGGHLKQWLSRVTCRYNITKEEAIELYNRPNCDICQVELTFDRTHSQRCVDHDHSTDKVRGVLCNGCNAGLGHLKDSKLIMNKAIRYLECHERKN